MNKENLKKIIKDAVMKALPQALTQCAEDLINEKEKKSGWSADSKISIPYEEENLELNKPVNLDAYWEITSPIELIPNMNKLKKLGIEQLSIYPKSKENKLLIEIKFANKNEKNS